MEKIISGKVRDVYDVDDNKLVIVTTDRISSFDVIIPKFVKDKGKLLNDISKFWFDYTSDIVKNHILTYDLKEMLRILPYEFIVRGYIFGNMWKAYEEGKEFCGYKIEGDYKEAEKLKEPILTPSTKASEGHDIYISFDEVKKDIGEDLAKKIYDVSFKIYEKCFEHAYKNGIIIADTKFEFGIDENGELVLADEILTPDSSRFWSLDDYEIGTSPKSYDKQFVRDWLLNNKKDGEIQYSEVPDEVLEKTSNLYRECKERLVNKGI